MKQKVKKYIRSFEGISGDKYQTNNNQKFNEEAK